MTQFNPDIADMLASRFRDLTFEKDGTSGYAVADKSYGFDTIYLAARFISRFSRDGYYHKHELVAKSDAYFRDLFMLGNTGQVPNYMTESLALFCFTGILEKQKGGVYRIKDLDLLDFVASGFENAYIFNYMVCRCMMENGGLWEMYVDFCNAPTLDRKQEIFDSIRAEIARRDSRVKSPDRNWALFVPKYFMVVLNYANRQNMVTRECNVKESITTRYDVAVNVNGSRGANRIPKRNGYIAELSEPYILATLGPYLAVGGEVYMDVETPDTFYADVTDAKLDTLDSANETGSARERMQQNPYRPTAPGRARTLQGVFRDGLRRTMHECPLCGFAIGPLLVAGHIKPYAQCDDPYDAGNSENGLLLCPLCDRLFEDGAHITVDSSTGRVIYDSHVGAEPRRRHLVDDAYLPSVYLTDERCAYLAWHNARFYHKHPDHLEAPAGA